MSARRWTAAWSTGALIVLCAVSARAEVTKAQCVAANTKAQSLRREGRFGGAREQLRMCSDLQCPALVSTDCVKRLDELENAQPTVVFDVKDASGRDLIDVQVKADGRVLVEKLDGKAVELDPGKHSLTFSARAVRPTTQELVLREGEKARRVQVTLDSTEAEPAGHTASAQPAVAATASSDGSRPPVNATNDAPATPDSTTATTPEGSASGASTETSSTSSPRKTLGIAVAGVGVAGLAVGGIFGYLALSAKNRQVDNCPSTSSCPDRGEAASAHESAQKYGTISTIAVAAGVATTIAGVVIVLSSKPSAEAPQSSSLTLNVGAVPGATGVHLRGAF